MQETATVDRSQPTLRGAIAVAATTLGIAALATLVFVIRAGDPGTANWPVTWELRSSDNGVLFQLMQDIAAGRPLDWVFSPQVYVFPELPISALAYLVTGGDIYAYYLVVAVINTCLLFLALLLLVRLLFPAEQLRAWLARSALAALPLLLLPLVGTSWLVSYHLAPTYYFGMYLVVLAAPALFLVRTRWARIAIAAVIVLTAASNPLALVFSFPAFVAVLVVRLIRGGPRAALRPAALGGAVVALALLVRFALFAPLQASSPFAYVDPDIFAGRLAALGPYFAYLRFDPSTDVIVTLGAMLAGLCLVGAGVLAWRYLSRSRPADDRLLAGIYLGLVPVTGLLGTLLLMITHYLYFWLVLIAPFVLVLLAIPRGWSARLLPLGAAGLVAVAIATSAIPNLAHPERYFGYRSPETQCLDENLPAGATLGYSTFSDARRVSLTSDRPFRLIQIRPDITPHEWLTNLSYLREETGSFFYINGRGDEWPLDRDKIVREFGEPDGEFSCGEAQTVLVYDDPVKIAAIAEYFHTLGGDPLRR